jgi:hypothetical protein
LNDADGDGVCNEFEIGGCTDAAACNFNAAATDNNGSCTYAASGYDCAGACVNDADGDGICNEFEVAGCTDAAACNYEADATDNDGSCTYAASGYDCAGACVNDADGDGICNEFEVAGCTDSTACNYDAAATDDNGSCDFASCYGCTYASASNFDASATFDDGSCAFAGCLNDDFASYNAYANAAGGVCTDAPISADFNGDGVVQNQDLLDFLLAYGQVGPVWGGLTWVQDACNVVAEPLSALWTAPDYCAGAAAPHCADLGCTYPTASNYDPAATVDSGDCVWTGCTDSDAINFNPLANLDDSSCTYDICPDFNGDGQVQAQDLLNFLLAWGTIY